MLGKTHVAAGVAASVAILHPATTPGIVSAIAGGAIGGWICDIDCQKSDLQKSFLPGLAFAVLVSTAALAVDHLARLGVCAYTVRTWGTQNGIGLALLLGCCLWGALSRHRSFTHSFLGVALLSFSVWLVMRPLAVPFCIGMLSHVALDLLNRRGVRLFYPLKKGFCMNLCDSSGPADMTLRQISVIVCVILVPVLLLLAASHQYVEPTRPGQGNFLFGLTGFQWYLVFVNCAAFLILCILHALRGHLRRKPDLQKLMTLLGLLGGPLGVLLSFTVLRQRITKQSAPRCLITVSLFMVWSVIFCILYDPFRLGFGAPDWSLTAHLPVLVYLAGINLVSAVLFFLDFRRRQQRWNGFDGLLFACGLLGGTLGGLAVMALTGSRGRKSLFLSGFPILLAAQVFSLGYWLLAGVI